MSKFGFSTFCCSAFRTSTKQRGAEILIMVGHAVRIDKRALFGFRVTGLVGVFAHWVNVYFGQFFRSRQKFGLHFGSVTVMYYFFERAGLHFGRFFSQTHPVTLLGFNLQPSAFSSVVASREGQQTDENGAHAHRNPETNVVKWLVLRPNSISYGYSAEGLKGTE
jgi:hypothetical protein